jgi:hypothetical protein
MNSFRVKLSFGIFALFILSSLLISPALFADGGANHQRRNQHFGVSGGNVNDITKRFCCSGTLGALLTDGTNQYILSNNHVLGLSGQATAGQDISQPGLIDNNCQVPTIVADFTNAAPLGSNVDAAIAQLRAGQMDGTGFIEDIGVPSSTVVNPSVGLGVAKSGRTTGFTTGTVSSINTSVSVQYQQNCGSGKKFTVSYTNQVVINSSTFSAGGDSGSLIVTNNASHNPVALLYAGSSSSTIGNPIGEVLTKLGASSGRSLSFVGSGGGAHAVEEAAILQEVRPTDEAIEQATVAMRGREQDLMARPSVIGVGVGTSESDAAEANIVVYVDATSGIQPRLPRRINGVRVRVIFTEPFIAY